MSCHGILILTIVVLVPTIFACGADKRFTSFGFVDSSSSLHRSIVAACSIWTNQGVIIISFSLNSLLRKLCSVKTQDCNLWML